MNSDHVSLQVGEGRQVEDALDEVGGARLAQPQKQGVSVLQQEHAGVGKRLLRAAHRGGKGIASQVHVVLLKRKNRVN